MAAPCRLTKKALLNTDGCGVRSAVGKTASSLATLRSHFTTRLSVPVNGARSHRSCRDERGPCAPQSRYPSRPRLGQLPAGCVAAAWLYLSGKFGAKKKVNGMVSGRGWHNARQFQGCLSIAWRSEKVRNDIRGSPVADEWALRR